MDYINNITGILKLNPNINFVYLFGSRVNNRIRYGSDLDIAVYFEAEPDTIEIGKLCFELESASGLEIDLVKLNHLYDSNPELAYNILNEGMLIFQKNIETVNGYKKNVILRYLDYKPVLDRFHSKFIERLSNNKFAV